MFLNGFTFRRCLICVDLSHDSDQMTFSLEKAILWIMTPKKILMDLFLTNMQLLASQDDNWWTGLDYLWIIVMFYQLFGLSFWRHPFTAEDPLVSKRWNAKFLQICSHEETNSSTSRMAWRWMHCQQESFYDCSFNTAVNYFVLFFT